MSIDSLIPGRSRVPRLVAAAALLAVAATSLAAQKRGAGGCPPEATRSICYSRIEADYSVLRSGDVFVTERFTVRFNGDWNGITRELIARATRHDFRPDSVREADPDTRYREVEIEVLGATDAAGTPLRIEQEQSSDEILLRIWVPNAQDAERVVVLSYRIEDGVTFFAEHDEFYWNVLGTTSTAPVVVMQVRVIPPEGATGVRAIANAGAANTRARNVDVAVGMALITATSTVPLGPGVGFTIVAGWDPGLVERPSALDRALDRLARWWSLIVPLLSLGLMWKLWERRGRDPAMLPIVTRYEAPTELSPGEVGTLLDERADMRDIMATLVDLAVQGRLRIEEVEGTKVFGLEFGEDYRFVETAPGAGARPEKRHEALLRSALFDGAQSVELSDLKNEFYRDLPGIREAMMDSLVENGIYDSRPDRTRVLWVVASAMFGVVLFFGLGLFTQTAPLALLIVPPLSALPILVVGWLMPRRTVKGTRTIERLHGFREFLERVDGDRLRRMKVDPSAFERILPYAMALGVEKKWAAAFDGLAQEPPHWYRARNGGRFHPSLFVADLGRMSTRTSSMMSSRPASSGGGSGFSGGGGVGGGGGGGGVGGF